MFFGQQSPNEAQSRLTPGLKIWRTPVTRLSGIDVDTTWKPALPRRHGYSETDTLSPVSANQRQALWIFSLVC